MRFLALLLLGFLVSSAEAVDFFADRCSGSLTNTCSECQSELTACFSITQAIACAEADGSGEADRVIVRTGIYREIITLGESGNATDPYILSGYPGEAPIIDGELLGLQDFDAMVTVAPNQTNIQIQNLIIRNGDLAATGNSIVGLKINASQSDIFARDLTITGMSGDAVEVSGAASKVTLDNLTVSDFGGNFGIFVRNAFLFAIRNSEISGGSAPGNVDGITIAHTSRFLVENNLVYDVCDGIDAGGVVASSTTFTEDGIVRFNHVRDLAAGPICNPRGLTINGGTGNNGIEDAQGHQRVTLYGNLAHDTDASSYEVYKGFRNFQYWNNTGIGNGLWVRGGCFGDPGFSPTGGIIKNNLMVGETGVTSVFSQWNALDPAGFTISHNLFRNEFGDAIQWDLDGNADGYNCPQVTTYNVSSFLSATGHGASSLDINPLFVDAGNDIYNVKTGSAVLNAGDWFMRATSGVTSTQIPVSSDPNQFFVPDNRFNNTTGDFVKIEGVAGLKKIVSMDTSNIFLSESVTVANGAGIHTPFFGTHPPIGARGLRGLRVKNTKIGSGVTIR